MKTFEAWKRKRMGDTGMDAGGLPPLDYSVETPAGEVDVTRKPLVAQSSAATVGGDDNDERPGILDDLSGGISVDERATLNDPRASASAVASRNDFDDMSNIFLSGGRAPIQQRPDPFKAERDSMRDWVMKRGGVARGQQSNELNADRTGAYLAATQAQKERAAAAAESQARKDGRLEEAEKHKSERLEMEAERKKLESERDQRNKDREFALKEKTEKRKGAGPKLGPDGKPVPSIQERRQGMKEAAIKPRPDWEPIDETATTFRDAQQAKSFDDAAAAYGALTNHRKHAAEAMDQFRNAKTPAEKDAALAIVNQQMANIASKLRVAEGLNSSDASNHAVDTMLSLQNGSVASLRNFANEGRLDAILDSAISSAGVNLETLGASNNIRRKKGGKAPVSAGERKTATLKDGSKVQLSADGKSWEPIK